MQDGEHGTGSGGAAGGVNPLFEKIVEHRACQRIVVVTYASGTRLEEAAVECEDCSAVIVSASKLEEVTSR